MKLPSRRSAAPAKGKSFDVFGWMGRKIGLTDSKFWQGWFGTETWAGEPVTPGGAMQLSAVWRAIRLTAETIASLPISLYEDQDGGPALVRGTETDLLMRVSPNDEQTPMEFWEQLIGCQELVGDGMAQRHFVGKRCVAWTIINPLKVAVKRNVQGGLVYDGVDDKGREFKLSPDEVLHLKGFSLGGDRGMSTVRYGAQTMSLAMAAQKTSGKLFKSGLRNSGFLNTGQVLDEPDRKRLHAIMQQYMGAENAGGLMVLEGGMTFSALNMSAQDAELLLTRKFEIEEIGRWFGLPPILLGHAVEGQTMWGSGVDSILQSWMTLGLRQRLVRIQQMVGKRGMSQEERGRRLYVKYNPDALLAVNSVQRIQVLSQGIQNTLITPDEGRALMERGKVPGGDQLLAQVNLVPLEQLGQISATDATAKQALKAWLDIKDTPRDPHPEGQ